MSGEPKAPAAPDSTFPLPPQAPPRFASPAAPTAPGIPSVMPASTHIVHAVAPLPGAYAPQPMYAAPLPSAGFVSPAPPGVFAAPAPATVQPSGPVLGVRDFYRFAEEPVGQRVQITILETPAMPPELPPPSKIDPGLEATRVALEAQLAGSAIAALPYVPPTATRWFRFSPLELFMEQVLARRLWTVE